MARQKGLPIDAIAFEFEVIDDKSIGDIKDGPEVGCYVRGLFLEGAAWDAVEHSLSSSRPKELYSEMPVIWFRPTQEKKMKENIYNCPVYKILTRAGTLSTTGHSTNFVMYIEIPTTRPASHWINCSAALFCSLAF